MNPYFRSSASESVKWKVFDEFKTMNKYKSNAPKKLKLEVDQDDAFDYEKTQKSNIHSLKDYQQMVTQIVDKVH